LSEFAEPLEIEQPEAVAPENVVEQVADDNEPPVEFASEPQRRLIFAKAKEAGVEQAELKAILVGITGQDSSAAIPRGAVEAVLLAVAAAGETVNA